MEIEVLQPSQAALLHAFRLRALQENPEAFGATFEEEAALPASEVSNRLQATPENFALGAFERQDRLVGVTGFMREGRIKSRHKGVVYGMFVAPEVRGRGVGKSLLAGIIGRAKYLKGLEQLVLDVVTVNAAARNLYLAAGFEPYGIEQRAMKQETEYFHVEHMVLYLR